MAARKGRQPKVMLMALYLPVRRIIHLEKNVEFEAMRGVKIPTRRRKTLLKYRNYLGVNAILYKS